MRILIGRNKTCDIVVHDEKADAIHATIAQEELDEFVLQDIESTNGTFILRENRWHVVNRVILQQGDIVVIGDTKIPWRKER